MSNTSLLSNVENSEDSPNESCLYQFPLEELYLTALQFYKDKSGKALHISYGDNLKLVAFARQAANGPFDVEKHSQLGVFDVIGRDRHYAWRDLGSMSETEAKKSFVTLLDKLCPLFHIHIEAIKRNITITGTTKMIRDYETPESSLGIIVDDVMKKDDHTDIYDGVCDHFKNLQDILNQQTFDQFKNYASQQFPGNPEQQALLIRQLQYEHYHQYMQQLHAKGNLFDMAGDESVDDFVKIKDFEQSTDFMPSGRMWTQSNIEAFKKEVSSGRGDGVIRIEHGETVTVRIPTHEAGDSIFWEFATDDYDIGFGVYFEWGKPTTNEVTVSISETDDDEDIYEEDDDADFLEPNCLETESNSDRRVSNQRKPITSIIVPVYRRECQKEVYIGCHSYPGHGMYLLKFDNSFSIWRSKTLYYKIYYERSI